VFAAGALKAASTDLGGAFTDTDTGTRPLGMGGAFTAVADDANATQENPAGMGFFGDKQHFATLSYANLYSLGILTQSYVAYAQGDQGYGAIGLSWQRLQASLDPNTWSEDEFVYSGAKLFMGSDDDAWPKLSVGWQLKYLQVNSDLTTDLAGTEVSGGDARGYGIGAGAMLKLRPSLTLGVMIQDLYSTLTWATGTIETIPLSLRGGAAYHVTDTTLFSAEVRGSDGSSGVGLSGWNGGVEHWIFDGKSLRWNFIKNVGVRAGYYDLFANQDSGVLTAGATVQTDMWQIDYSFEYAVSDTNQLGNTQRFGLGANF
jgi:hypothetical protein